MKLLNGWLCQINERSINPIFADIEIKNGIITDVYQKSFSFSNFTKSNKIDEINLEGKVITIPNVNYHDHIYSRLAKGLDIKGDLSNFPNILKNLWWKLDALLDINMIKASASYAALESIKQGVTYIIDHHSSPNSASGSLNTISDELLKFGIRNVMCFETSDRNGKKLTEDGINENIDFYENHTNKDAKSLFGLHASFTLDDDTLEQISDYVNSNKIGTHIHLCEDISDKEISKDKYGSTPIERLIKNKILNDESIVAHGIHLEKDEYEKLAATGASLVLNLDSNMNNSVGLQTFKNFPNNLSILLGTDGMHANMSRSMKELFLQIRHAGFSFDEAFTFMIKVFFDQLRFIKKFFPDFSSLHVDDRADLIVWDYIPPTPLTEQNFWGHYLYGILESNVSSVVINGELKLKDNTLVNVNESIIREEIYKYGTELFSKFNEE